METSQRAPDLIWRRKARGVTVTSSRYARVQTWFFGIPFLGGTGLFRGLGS